MKKICDNVMIALAEGEQLSPELERHLESCPDCALFRRTMSLQFNDSGFTVPETLDAAVHEAARKHIVAMKWKIWKIALPIAASFAVCFGFAFYAYLPQTAQVAPQQGRQKPAAVSSWNTSDFDDSLITLTCDVARGYTAITNVYDTLN